MRALLERAARAVDDNAPDADALCNMAKVFASEEIVKVAQHCLELHGGNGVMLDFGVEKIFRDAAVFLHMDATVDISQLQDRQGDVSRHRRQICRAGVGRVRAPQLFCVSRNPISTIAKPASCARLGTSPSARKPISSVKPGTSDGNTAARPAPSSTTERVNR